MKEKESEAIMDDKYRQPLWYAKFVLATLLYTHIILFLLGILSTSIIGTSLSNLIFANYELQLIIGSFCTAPYVFKRLA
ncbi:hypothetical protein [Shewanella waksmanii]|uniref:hypothetical protein n=1 Tax=Shewanella waksmanii TaxID=213783 RepID=UPI0037354775